MPQIVILAGANGAGKTTLSPVLLRDRFGVMEYVNADPIARGLSSFRPESVAIEAGRTMLRRLHELAQQGRSFAFETTLATRSYARWLKDLRSSGYRVHVLFLWLRSPELAVRRVQERVRAGGHDVPENVVRRRYWKGIANFFHLYRPLSDTWAVYDNSHAGSSMIIASGANHDKMKIEDRKLWVEFESQKIHG